jgi:hypothetical protein
MKVARVLGLIAIVVAACPVLLAVTAAPAAACSCLALDDDEAFSLADAVFTGSAVDRRVPSDPTAPTTLVFAVDHVYKGDVVATQEIRTPSSSAACGLSPDRSRLLVFAAEPGTTESGALDASDGQLVAFLCGGTRTVSADAVPASFGTGRAPPVDEAAEGGGGSRGWLVAAVALGVVLVGAGAVVALRRRAAPDHSPSGGGAKP